MDTGYWFTTENGTHVHADAGQSKAAAISERFTPNSSTFTPSVKSSGKKGDMIQRIGEQLSVDLSTVMEPRMQGSRKMLGVHLEDLPKNEEARVREFLSKKGITIHDNGGYGQAIQLY